jgi:FkbM family methyltransferase
MSFFNFEWLKQNFNKDNFVFFEIGTAYIDTSIRVRSLFPTSEIYAFEAAAYWHEENEELAAQHNIKYFRYAVCDRDGKILFYPSETQNGEPHVWSSSIFELRDAPDNNTFGKKYGEPYVVKSIRLDTFCNEHNVCPDMIHIDVEGAEFKVFQGIGPYRPKCVWAEVVTFGHYDTGIDYDDFNSLMESLDYQMTFRTDNDALYCRVGFNTTPYISTEN